jgi:hypothetical protein
MEDLLASTNFVLFLSLRKEKMSSKHIRVFLLAALLEGVLALLFFLSRPSDIESARLLGFSYFRLGMAAADLIILGLLTLFTFKFFRNEGWAERITQNLARVLEKPVIDFGKLLFMVQGAFVLAILALTELFILSWLSFPPPLRPMLVWAILICMQAWLILRIVYAADYLRRPSMAVRLRSKWNGLLPVQRKVFVILALIGLVYFLAFIPFNLLPDIFGRIFVLGDERVIYPDVVRVLTPQANFSATVDAVFASWGWPYGYPYLPISASVLVVPRLIFGTQFGHHIKLNIFLLRQFVSVLPMVLALMLAVYLLTRYRSVRASVGMFVFLMLIPGIVKNNYQFWHPDAIILLLILLTIYFLQKDDLRFGRYFYLAAVACGLTTAIKLWGLFFFLAIAGYLIAGLIQHKLTFKNMAISGVLFILAMLATIIITSPPLLSPYVAQLAINSWTGQQEKILLGPERIDPTGYYQTTLTNWLKYFGQHFMQGYFFFFAFFALGFGSFWGSKKVLNRFLLGWCLPATIFLAYFSAMKSFQYMLPVGIPLYCGAFLFPNITDNPPFSKSLAFLSRPLTRKIIWGITLALFASQLIVNLIILYLFVIRGR